MFLALWRVLVNQTVFSKPPPQLNFGRKAEKAKEKELLMAAEERDEYF